MIAFSSKFAYDIEDFRGKMCTIAFFSIKVHISMIKVNVELIISRWHSLNCISIINYMGNCVEKWYLLTFASIVKIRICSF